MSHVRGCKKHTKKKKNKTHLDIFLESKPRRLEEPAASHRRVHLCHPLHIAFKNGFWSQVSWVPLKQSPHNQAKRAPTSPSKHCSWHRAGLERSRGFQQPAAPRTHQAYGMGQHGGYLTLTRLEINYSVQVWPRLCR